MPDHATTGDAINHAVDKVGGGISQITDAISSAAPKVAQVTLATVQADAVANVIYGIEALLVVALILLFWRKVYWPWAKHVGDTDLDVPAVLAGGVMVLAIGVFGFVAISTIFDPWTYIAMQHPDMYLAHEVIAKLTSASK